MSCTAPPVVDRRQARDTPARCTVCRAKTWHVNALCTDHGGDGLGTYEPDVEGPR